MILQSHPWAYIWRKLSFKKIQSPHPMFTEALFTTVKTWKQPECPSADEWIKNMSYRYTTEYYSAIEKNEILAFAAKMDGPRDPAFAWFELLCRVRPLRVSLGH